MKQAPTVLVSACLFLFRDFKEKQPYRSREQCGLPARL